MDSIRQTDAILAYGGDTESPQETEWPAAEFIIGNPPFLGRKAVAFREQLGDEYVNALYSVSTAESQCPIRSRYVSATGSRTRGPCWKTGRQDRAAPDCWPRKAIRGQSLTDGCWQRIKDSGDIFAGVV